QADIGGGLGGGHRVLGRRPVLFKLPGSSFVTQHRGIRLPGGAMCGEPPADGAFRGPVGYLHQDVGYTDLHCHLLPGVDDGPSTLDESLAYAAAAVAAGTTTIIAPPHVEPREAQH